MVANRLVAWCARILLCLSCLTGGTTLFAAGGENVLLRKVYSGNVAYIANGTSFRSTTNNCDFFNPMSTTVNLNIPVGAAIIEAFLYYAGSADIGPNYHTSEIKLANQTSLKLNGVSIPTVAGANGRDFPNLTALGSGVVDFFGARRDVSSIVTGPGAYTLSGMVVHRENQGRPPTGTCLGAWGLIVIFKDPNISRVRVVNLFDGFKAFKNSTFDLQPRNFVVGDTSPFGKMTHMSYEGDASISGTENFQIQVGTGGFTVKTNGLNPANNQYNSTVTGLKVFDVNTTYGFDLDTYDISSNLASQPDAFDATTRYNSGTDLVLLMAEVFSVDNKALADIELTLNDVGLFNQNTTDGAQYIISIKNNGDGLNLVSTGEATGYIHVYDDLPTGIDIDNLGDLTTPGWDCSATDLGTNKVRCSYNLSTLSGGQLDRNDSLPDIIITADVASPGAPVTNRAYVTLCDTAIDTCTTFDEKHTDSSQFDQKNFFEEFEDLFDVLSKSSTNNNVEAVTTPIIVGSPSDLSTSTKSVVDLNGGMILPGDILEYTITLKETNSVAATGIDVTDLIDTDLTSFAYQNTTCGGTATTNFSFGTFTISDLTVPANGSCNVVFRATIRPSTSAGTKIDNTANIANGNGTDGSATAPTRLVAGTAIGSKLLYLDQLNVASRKLTRVQPPTNTSITFTATNQVRTMLLNPLLAKDIDVSSGVLPVNVWIQAGTTGNYTIRARIRSNTTGDNVLTGEKTMTNVGMTAGIGNALLFPFQLNIPSTITNFDTGENIALEIRNSNTSAGTITLHSKLQTIDSTVGLAAQNVINVDSISFFYDVARTNEIVTGVDTIEAGKTIYIAATISDPFGFADITGARLTLIDPNIADQLTNVVMTQASTTTSTKTYTYAYTIPAAASIDPGVWVTQVTGYEGVEGTVTHTDADSFETVAPTIEVDYTVNVLTASPSDLLTYTITITNGGAATTLDISQAAPVGTNNLSIITLPSGDDSASNGTTLDIQNINAPNGVTVIQFTVNVLGSAQPGDLIDHTISLDNMGTNVTDPAPSVLISPYLAPAGNKTLYADAFGTAGRFDRTVPTNNLTRVIAGQGGSRTFTLAPVLQSPLTLNSGNIATSLWVSRAAGGFAGTRTIQARLAYTGAASGTIDTKSVTIKLSPGLAGAQYIPFNFNLPSTLVLPANTSLTLKVTNNTTIAGETITVHTFKDSTNPTRINLNANAPLTVTAVEFLNNSTDGGGVVVTSAGTNDTIWVRATVQDPFGRADITGATVTITDPAANPTATNAPMTIPTTQPASAAQRYFEYSHTLTSTLGDWTATVTAVEGTEGLVSANNSGVLAVNDLNPDLTDSYKYVVNSTTGDNADTNAGDTLLYTIELVEIGASEAANVSIADVIPANTTFVSGSLTVGGVVQSDPGGGTINLTGLTVPASGSLTIEFEVTVNGGTPVGTIISNSADITNPDGAVTDISVDAEDLLINGPPASGTKFLYLEDLDSTPILTRVRPATADNNNRISVQNDGGFVTLSLTPELAKDIAIPTNDIVVTLRLQADSNKDRDIEVDVDLDYINGGTITSIGNTDTQDLNLLENTVTTHTFVIDGVSATTIPAGSSIRLTVTNQQKQKNRDMFVYSHDSGNNRSNVRILPTPVINVDSITFWTDTMGAGTQTSNPNPTSPEDIYARIVVSDPFGEADIQPPFAVVNPMTATLTSPIGAVTDGGTNTGCTAPCFAYDAEDTVNDVDPATRTFYYIVRLDSATPSNRGNWIFQATANEGLETAPVVSHTNAGSFTTALAASLTGSTKSHNVLADVQVGDQFTYTITLDNSGGIDADNVEFTDILQTSPVALSFVNAATSCKDEVGTALPSPSHSSGTVTLTNISVPAGGSCVVSVAVQLGAGNPGDLIDNTADIFNPFGAGATPAAPTILYQESQIPVAGSKQLYLDQLNGTPILTRTYPTGTTDITLDGGGTNNVTLTLNNSTTRAMTLQDGAVDINLMLSKTGHKSDNRLTTILLRVDPGTGTFQDVDSVQINLALTTTPTLTTFNLVKSGDLSLGVNSRFRLVVTNSQNQNNRRLVVTQSLASGIPQSEVIVPLLDPIAVTEVKFFDRSATDTTGNPGCDATFSCGTEIDPGLVLAGNTIWTRATIADSFGAFDVNTGSQNCDGVTVDNCPTITVTDPASSSSVFNMEFLNEPDGTSRQYEYEVNPAGFGLDGIWQVVVEGSEGLEGVVIDTGINTFERYGLPVLTIVKLVDGVTSTTKSPQSIANYTNDVTNTGDGPATAVQLTNSIGDFVDLELTDNGGTWTALFSLSGLYTVSSETFSTDGIGFGYDPNTTGICALPAASPCYDPAITHWRILLNDSIPISGSLTQGYRARIE